MPPSYQILVLQGPNLNLLGEREPHLYGSTTLAQLHQQLTDYAQSLHFQLDFFQSNHEGALIDRLHEGRALTHGAVFNPGGYTHTSVALRDAIAAVRYPVIEVHLTNTAARESFRQHSLTGGSCLGRIEGFGTDSYLLALDALARHFARTANGTPTPR